MRDALRFVLLPLRRADGSFALPLPGRCRRMRLTGRLRDGTAGPRCLIAVTGRDGFAGPIPGKVGTWAIPGRLAGKTTDFGSVNRGSSPRPGAREPASSALVRQPRTG